MPRLDDPWFEAEFYGQATADSHVRQGLRLDGAQGLFLYCPCRYGQTDGAHTLLVPFANPRGAPPPPPDHGPTNTAPSKPRPRWTLDQNSTGLGDLSLSPSVDVGSDHCWHGFITSGEVTP